MNHATQNNPLVTVVITSYNHARFLPEAINSVLQQTYSPVEIIVVDDGSTDHTQQVVQRFKGVNYIFQFNAGLSAARNTGIDHSNGDYLVFLDADDWLYPDALKANVNYLNRNASLAFVSGWHDKVDENYKVILNDEPTEVSTDHYLQLLKGNYIGMHAAVMYRKNIIDHFRFDTSLKACEDYDLYLRIAREHPVYHHTKKLAAYRIHGYNMSSKIPFMLDHVLEVCHRQEPLLKTNEEKSAFRNGLEIWNEYYSDRLYNDLMYHPNRKNSFPSQEEIGVLIKNKPMHFVKLSLYKTREMVKSRLKNNLPDKVLKTLHTVGAYKNYTPPPGKVNAGDFERTIPFSNDFGFDRGGAIDRYYIENFLEYNKNLISGRVLEIGDNDYTLRFGEDRISKSDILHVDSSNPKATIIGDISDAPQIPSDSFDCIILTQTLHLIYDFKAALKTCHRILKPGGALLLTVPGISHIDRGPWKDYWLWSFTDQAMHQVMREVFKSTSCEVATYGNVFISSAFLFGMGLPEIKPQYLDQHDPCYQLIVSVKAIKE